MTNKQIIKKYRKREQIIGHWGAKNDYDAWDIFIGKNKWCQLQAVTKKPIEIMLKNYPFANINWNTVRAIKLT